MKVRALGINTLLQEIVHMQGKQNQQRALGLGVDVGVVLAAGSIGYEIDSTLLFQLSALLRSGAAFHQLVCIFGGQHPGRIGHRGVGTGLHPVRLKPRPQVHRGAVDGFTQLQVLINIVIDVSRITHGGYRILYHFCPAVASTNVIIHATFTCAGKLCRRSELKSRAPIAADSDLSGRASKNIS